ncbi:unnamed protein product [Allacma fusca]|uniref:Uncharacterized protein n=1 Tax=Allacma fusca TaxID=39272 RepID=A0A8J2PK97_9HEXA|nr:unnamed protein product [Allacma fusca]
MEPQPEKRIRGDENSDKGGLTSGTSYSNCPNSNEYQDFIETFPELVSHVSQQFPKVTSFTFTISKFDPTTITVGNIFEAFPNLRNLSLEGRCDFKNISGMDNATIAEYVEQGLPIETIPRQKSITDFMELETIVFGSCFDVDPDMVRYCLPRVPKLREVTLHWNDSLSEPLLRDSIGHLKRNMLKTEAIEFESGPFY